jgi:hypothetical protein
MVEAFLKPANLLVQEADSPFIRGLVLKSMNVDANFPRAGELHPAGAGSASITEA